MLNIYQPRTPLSLAPQDNKYISLPYLGHYSLLLKSELNKTFKKHFPQINFKFIFTNRHKFHCLFQHKDRIDYSLNSNVVYKYTCPDCKSGYIGNTSRLLFQRASDHVGISWRSGDPLNRLSFSSIRDHHRRSTTCSPHPSTDDFKILAQNSNDLARSILEALYIQIHKPELNQDRGLSLLICWSVMPYITCFYFCVMSLFPVLFT